MILLDESNPVNAANVVCFRCLQKDTKNKALVERLQVEVLRADLAERERDSWKRAYKAMDGEK